MGISRVAKQAILNSFLSYDRNNYVQIVTGMPFSLKFKGRSLDKLPLNIELEVVNCDESAEDIDHE